MRVSATFIYSRRAGGNRTSHRVGELLGIIAGLNRENEMNIGRHNPSWLIRLARKVGKMRRFFTVYRFFRCMHHSRADALTKARNTLS